VRVFATILQSFNIRYLTTLSDTIVKALQVLDTSRWPVYKQQDTAELDAYGNDDISPVVSSLHDWGFEDTTGAKVPAQWEQMKQRSRPIRSCREWNSTCCGHECSAGAAS
jgi:hypothetical protein